MTTTDTTTELAWARRKRWPSVGSTSEALRVVDLFCGCGGSMLGVWDAARRAGRAVDILWANDSNAHAAKVYTQNFNLNDDRFLVGDVNSVFSRSMHAELNPVETALRRRCGRIDLLVAGPPCQGHSDLNNTSRRRDPRNQLYLVPVRAAMVLRPEVVIIENVPAVVRASDRVVQKAQLALLEMQYSCFQLTLDVARLGVPQNRKRHILIALRSGHELEPSLLLPAGYPATSLEWMADIVDVADRGVSTFDTPSHPAPHNQARIDYLFDNDIYDLPDELRPKCHREKPHSYASMYGRMYGDRPSQTITSGFGSMGQGRFVHPTRRRMITPHEAARLQGFPDFYAFASVQSRVALQEMIGNAIPPHLARHLVHTLIEESIL